MPEVNQPNAKPRPGVLIALIIGVAVLFTMVLWQVSFRVGFDPRTTNQTLILVALSALIFLLFVALTFVLLRNLLKLYAERRVGVLGSKFRSRMVVGALILSVIPVFVLFLFAYGLMNRSIERWFSRPVEDLLEDSSQVTGLLSHYAIENANVEAEAIADIPETQRSFNSSTLVDEFRARQKTLQGGFALALSNDSLVAGYNLPEGWGDLRKKIPLASPTGPQNAAPFNLNGRDYIMGVAHVRNNSNNLILVAIPLPPGFRQTINHIEVADNTYRELSKQSKILRSTYTGLLLLITMIVLFSATWLALFLSKLVTRPVAALATATQEISRGHLDYRVEIPAMDELGELVASFNGMAAELETSRHAIEASSSQLTSANVELEQRRRDIETILETIPTGVLTLDASGCITRANHALTRMLTAVITAGGMPSFPLGAGLGSLFHEDVVADLETMMRKADRMGSVTSQMEIQVQASRTSLDVAVTVAALQHGPQKLGYVIVFEDLSDLLKAQKQAAWREVARRVAHEIKNPLTPIALSAERIRRHLERGSPPDEASLQVIGTCSATIAEAVETVRTLVDEFSAMARFPTSQPQPSDINTIIQSALSMFNGRLEGIQVNTDLAPDLPPVMADPNAMKRVIANIVDNAADAVQDSLVREVHISTSLVQTGEMVEIVIADTGHGVSREVKEKLFLPYFSTKRRGTGLGLAIVGRIMEDHHGSVRVEENSPLGARFIVELPVANGAPSGATGRIELPDHA
ncbi:MAG TPA: ATP-binding protein [Terriglobales bacterium]|jgi:two-component system nitrogen regulation sensor histidine kinase NtrY|nr:ATP-binding protein [Terriglobales bacterium]